MAYAPVRDDNPYDVPYFYSDVWRLANPAAGQGSRWGAINWVIRLDDGTYLTDPEHRRLLWHIKVLVASAIVDPRGAAAISEGGLSSVSQSIATAASWMVSAGLSDFSTLGNEASLKLLEYFKSKYENSGGNDHRVRKKTWSSASLRLRFPALLYRQQPSLVEKGVLVLAEAPFEGRAINDVVMRELQLYKGDKQTPIPDNVFLSAISGAYRLLYEAADDVIELQALCSPQLIDQGGSVTRILYAKMSNLVSSYVPATLPGESSPWIDLSKSYRRTMDDGREVGVEGRQIVRRAIIAIQSACVITIQSLTALRVDQLASIEDESFIGDLPSCVLSKPSADGLMEHFYVANVNLKANDKDLALVGSRPWGSDHLPPVVQALSVLHRLTIPWRALGGTKRLMLVFTNARGLPRTGDQIGDPKSTGITIAEREFFRDWCDHSKLTAEEKMEYVSGKGLRDQKWRTTYAIYKMRIDDRLLPAIAEHFTHMRISTTEHCYVGSDARTMGSEIDPAYYATAKYMHDILEGGEAVVGRLEAFIRSFGKRYRGTVQEYELAVTSLDIRFFVFDYGVCGMSAMPEKSQCNLNAGTASWRRVTPNEAFRTPLTCIGCPCFAASTVHLSYWEERAENLERHLAQADELESNPRAVLELRLRTARAVRDGLRSAIRRKDEEIH